MFRLVAVILALFLGACADETVSGFTSPDAIYRLEEFNGAPFPARATINFPRKGRVAGQAPCNSYTGTLAAVYPWFQAAPLAVTPTACPDMAAERKFLGALEAARFAEFSWPVLILSNQRGLELVFRAE